MANAAVILETRIPEYRTVTGLEYGAHVSMIGSGWSGYFVRAAGTGQWVIARLTTDGDELPDPDQTLDDAAVRAYSQPTNILPFVRS